MQHPFEALRPEYERWVAAVLPRPEMIGIIDSVARRLTRPEALANFEAVRARLLIPDVVQAVICEREDNCDFTKYPGNGQPLNRVTTIVPRGRGPWPTWIDGAIDAFHVVDHLDDNSAPWALPYSCWKWEGFNGFGYRAHGIRTPYVVGGTNLQQPGKYVADGVFDPSHMDTQLGCLPIAKRMIELVPSLAFGTAIASAAIETVPPVAPVPVSVGGGLTGAKWVQSALNLAGHLVPPLLVDGSYGRETRAAVRAWQAGHGLPANGLVDSALCASLDAALAALKPAT